jgi:HEAT repeat protein
VALGTLGSASVLAGDLAAGKAALVLYDDAGSRPLVERLSRLLRERYGFDAEITRVLGPQVRRGDLALALGELESHLQQREATDLLVVVALVGQTVGRDTSIRLADSNPDEPWRWPRVASLLEYAEGMNTRGVLFITPSCAASDEAASPGSLQYRPPTRGSLSVITFCDGVGGERVPAQLLKALGDELAERSDRQGEPLDARGVTSALGRRMGPLAITLQQPPDAQERQFAFVPTQDDLGAYERKLRSATGDEERRSVLQALLLAANGSPQSLGPSASALCERVAFDDTLPLDARREATGALARIHHPSAMAGLARIGQATSLDTELRIDALSHLSRMGDRTTMAKLQNDPDQRVQTAAVRFGVGVLGSEGAEVWSQGLTSEDAGVKLAAVRGLSSLKRPEDRARFRDVLLDGRNAARIRGEAAEALRRTGVEPPFDDALLEALGDEDAIVRRACAYALAKSESTPEMAKRIEDALIEHLSTDVPEVQEGAAFALGERKSEAARKRLESALGSSKTEEPVRIAAAKALGQIAHAESTGVLAAAAAGGTAGVRRASTEALGYIPTGAAATAILDRLADPDPYVSEQARASLEQVQVFNRRDVLLRVAASSPKVRAGAIRVIQKNDRPEYTELVLRALADEDPEVRRVAVQGLSARKDDATVASLETILDGTSPAAREAAAAALGRMHTDAASDALIRRAGDDTSPAHEAAVRALGETDETARPVLTRALDSQDPQVQNAAIEALAAQQRRKRDPGVTQKLREVAAPENPAEVRQKALEALAAENPTLYKLSPPPQAGAK